MVPSAATEKIPSDTTGNRSRDRPTSSAVPTLPEARYSLLLLLLLLPTIIGLMLYIARHNLCNDYTVVPRYSVNVVWHFIF